MGAAGVKSRVLGIAIVGFLYALGYYLGNRIPAGQPEANLWDFHTVADDWIPYIPGTWIFYYGGFLYASAWAATIVWRLEPDSFRRAMEAYGGMLIVAAILYLTFPAKSPWELHSNALQRFMHTTLPMGTYNSFPSMHAALSILPACIGLATLRRRWVARLSLLGAVLVTVSTVTLKEHYCIDALAGTVLALLAFFYWRARRVRCDGVDA